MSQPRNGSFIQLPAAEVKRLCLETIRNINAQREKYKRDVIETHKNDRCTHLFGLVSHKRFDSEDEILDNTLAGNLVKDWAKYDLATAESLLRAANWILENDKEQKINVGTDDLRAIS